LCAMSFDHHLRRSSAARVSGQQSAVRPLTGLIACGQAFFSHNRR
jgi:hypothetical protein